MAIGKIVNKRDEGVGNDKRQIIHIVLLPSFPSDRYKELTPSTPGAGGIAGTTLWSESGHQLEVISNEHRIGEERYSQQYPYLLAKSLDAGNVYGKVTTDDKEATAWIKKVANELLPSNVRGVPLWTGIAQWSIKWKPLKEALDLSESTDKAYRALQDIRNAKDGPSTSFGRPYAGGPSVTVTATSEGRKAVTEAGKELKSAASDLIGEIGWGWKIAAIGTIVVIGAMAISERSN